MIRKCSTPFTGVQSLLVVITVLAATVTPTSADADTITPVDVKLSLDTPSTIVQGEPILLRYIITNRSPNQKLGTHMGIYDTEWYTLTLTDSVGNSAPPIADLRPAQPRGAFTWKGGLLGPSDHDDDYIVVTRSFTVTHPGKYILTAHVHLPYGTAPASAEGLAEPYIQAAGTVFTHDYVFPLTVLPPDNATLQKTAASLEKAVVDKNAPPEANRRRQVQEEALFAMPEAAAAESWKALAGIDATGTAKQLKRVNTPGAADILADLYANPTLSVEQHAAVGQSLNEMYNGGDDRLKTHLQGIGKSFGLTLPPKIAVPETID